jgi:hypothetical protein
MEEWEERLTAMMLRDLGLTTTGSKGNRRHLFYGAEHGGGLGFVGLNDVIRADQLMGYMARRSAVGTVQARVAQYQEARLAQLVEAHAWTTWTGTEEEGTPSESVWAMQRVHKAVPEGGEIVYAPIPWTVEGGGRGQGLEAYPSGILEELQKMGGAVEKMQERVREGWEKQVREQQRCDARVLIEAERKEITMSEGETVGFDAFLAQQLELEPSKSDTVPPAPSARRRAVFARYFMQLVEQEEGVSKSAYAKAVSAAETAALTLKSAEFGEEWLEVYSDASMQRGEHAAEDKCGVGVWVAHKANEKGELSELTTKDQCVAIHLVWEGLERVDSTVGELFGAIIAVLGASASEELQELTVVVKLDNKGVVDHYNSGGTEPLVRQRLRQHARGLWNVLHYLVRLRNKISKTKVVFVWLRARHNQLATEECNDGEGSDLVDEPAKVALFADDPRCTGVVVWQQGDEVAVGKDGEKIEGRAWPLGEMETVIYLPDAEGKMLPVTSNVRRSVLRHGLQQERLSLWATCSKRAEKLVMGIRRGEMKVLSSKGKGAWRRPKHRDDRTE